MEAAAGAGRACGAGRQRERQGCELDGGGRFCAKGAAAHAPTGGPPTPAHACAAPGSMEGGRWEWRRERVGARAHTDTRAPATPPQKTRAGKTRAPRSHTRTSATPVRPVTDAALRSSAAAVERSMGDKGSARWGKKRERNPRVSTTIERFFLLLLPLAPPSSCLPSPGARSGGVSPSLAGSVAGTPFCAARRLLFFRVETAMLLARHARAAAARLQAAG